MCVSAQNFIGFIIDSLLLPVHILPLVYVSMLLRLRDDWSNFLDGVLH